MKVSICFLLLSFLCFGETQLLASASNQEDDTVTKLFLQLGENGNIKRLDAKYYLDEREVRQSLFSPEELPRGIVLDQRGGKEIIKLFSDNFSPHQGGEIYLSFLYNGVTGARRHTIIDLARDGDEWTLYRQGRPVKELRFISRKWWGRTIGILRTDYVYDDGIIEREGA